MTLRRPLVSFAMLIAGAALLFTALTHTAAGGSDQGRRARSTSACSRRLRPTSIRPSPTRWHLLDATCARLMTFPDAPPPAGLRLVPEVAAAYPRVSSDGKTYTFTLRSGFRFSDGTPVQASAFAHAIEPHPRAWDRLGRRAVSCRTSSAPAPFQAGQSRRPLRGRRGREPSRRQVHAARSRLRRADGDDVLLRRAADASRPTPRESPPSPARARTTSRSSCAASASCWNGTASTGGTRPHHVDRFVVDLQAAHAPGSAQPDRARRGRLGFVTPPSATSTRRKGWSGSTESTGRSSSSSRGSPCGATT